MTLFSNNPKLFNGSYYGKIVIFIIFVQIFFSIEKGLIQHFCRYQSCAKVLQSHNLLQALQCDYSLASVFTLKIIHAQLVVQCIYVTAAPSSVTDGQHLLYTTLCTTLIPKLGEGSSDTQSTTAGHTIAIPTVTKRFIMASYHIIGLYDTHVKNVNAIKSEGLMF